MIQLNTQSILVQCWQEMKEDGRGYTWAIDAENADPAQPCSAVRWRILVTNLPLFHTNINTNLRDFELQFQAYGYIAASNPPFLYSRCSCSL